MSNITTLVLATQDFVWAIFAVAKTLGRVRL